MPKFDPYETLGVTREAPDFVIQAAYRACIKRYHPDHNKNADARTRTEAVLEAYRLIGDVEARARYDRANPPKTPRTTSEERQSSAPPPPPPPPPATNSDPPSRGAYYSPVRANLRHIRLAQVAIVIAIVIISVLGYEKKSANEDVPSTNDSRIDFATPAATEAGPSALARVEPQLPALDQIIRFKDASHCEMTNSTEKLFSSLIKLDPKTYVGSRGNPIVLPGFSKPLVPTHSRRVDKGDRYDIRDNEARLELPGLWRGLKVSAIRYRFMEESSFWEMQVRFLETPAHVREVLNELGFSVPAVGEFKETSNPDTVTTGMGVEQIPGGAALTCGSSMYY